MSGVCFGVHPYNYSNINSFKTGTIAVSGLEWLLLTFVPDMNKLLARFGLDWFLIAIIVMVLMARYFPALGLMEEPISLHEELANYGVSGIFFSMA